MRPEQVVRPGDVVRCKVTSVDPEKARVVLSLKRMQVSRPCLHLPCLPLQYSAACAAWHVEVNARFP